VRTQVVNIRNRACDVYIGRAMRGRPGSPFANPFRITANASREQVISRYRLWLAQQPELLQALEGLRGKRLGCWCKPLACHGDVLVELLEGPEPDSPRQENLF